MTEVVETEGFQTFIRDLRDRQAVRRINVRIKRLREGNPGEARSVGDGCSELVFDFGPGYRVYYGKRGEELVILLGGSDKSDQSKAIATAKEDWTLWKRQNPESNRTEKE